MKNRLLEQAIILGTPLMIFCLWSIYTHYNLVNTFLLPSPYKVWLTFLSLMEDALLLKHVLTSIYRVLFGFSIALILGILCAFLFYFFPNIAKSQQIVFKFLQNILPLALLSLLVLWFGIGE